jgi:spermidine/putrescine transport system substrate-binding protein
MAAGRLSRRSMLVAAAGLATGCLGDDPARTTTRAGARSRRLGVLARAGDLPAEWVRPLAAAAALRVSFELAADEADLYRRVRDERGRHDVVVADALTIYLLAAAGLLAELDPDRLGGLGAIDAAFLDRPFDPGNRHSVPHSYAALGFGLRADRVAEVPSTWAGFYGMLPAHVGVGVNWLAGADRNVALALAAADRDLDSDDAAALADAHAVLRRSRLAVDTISDRYASRFVAGALAVSAGTNDGFAPVLRTASRRRDSVFVLPEGRSLLELRSWAVPAAAPDPAAAHAWIRDAIAPAAVARAWTITGRSYPSARAAALLPSTLRDDPLVAVAAEKIARYETPVPSPAGVQARAEIWLDVVAA